MSFLSMLKIMMHIIPMASYTDLIDDKEGTGESGSELCVLRLNKGIPICPGEKDREKRLWF